MGRRSVMDSPWHNCTRCGRKTHLDEMVRQRGILICTRSSCFDTSLVGEREVMIAKSIANAPNLNEMNPEPKLAEQVVSLDEDISF